MKKLKKWLPPEIIRIMRHIAGYGCHFRGEYTSWEEAAALTEGYDAEQILEKVLNNTIKVRDGEAEYERDSVLFYERDDRYPLIAAIMLSAVTNGGNLRVLDFGGGLGSAYFQHRHWLADLPSVKWCVVEQKNFVDAGNKNLNDGKLSFEYSIENAFTNENYNIVIFSGVLQYIKDFSIYLRQAVDKKPTFIFIDRTPTTQSEKNIICTQKNAATSVIKSSYPTRLFSIKSLLAAVGNDYNLISDFEALDKPCGGIKTRIEYKGFLLKKA